MEYEYALQLQDQLLTASNKNDSNSNTSKRSEAGTGIPSYQLAYDHRMTFLIWKASHPKVHSEIYFLLLEGFEKY